MRRRLRWWWFLPVLAGIGAVLAGGAVIVFPAVAATSCPWCFGLREAAPGVFVGAGATPEQTRTVTDLTAAARRQVREFYGEQQSSPTVLACFDDACYARIGGGRERGVAVLNRAVMLSPRGLDVTILAHEMSHVELHQRLDGVPVPQWFDEGLAVIVGDDRRYVAPPGSADRCLVRPDGPLPASLADWLAAASADANEYAKAACPVSRWLAGHPGLPEAVTELVVRMRAGATFAAVVGQDN